MLHRWPVLVLEVLRCQNMEKPFTVVLVILVTACELVRGEEGLGACFIFGDSLVDSGNNNYLPTLSKANIRPNGIDFKPSGGRPTGRYTNGRTIADIISEKLGQPNYSPPFLAPGTKGSAILHGVNYASGGGGIMNQTGGIFINRLGLDVQIDYFNITRQQFDGLLGKAKAKDYIMKKSIFSITIGANDFLNNYLLPVVSIGQRILQSPDLFVDHLIRNLRGQLTRLYALDARKFVVGDIGPIGCIPYQKTINQVNAADCVSVPNQLALKYNARLKDLLMELNENLPGATLLHANVYDLVMELITNYQSYGFETASAACCSNGPMTGVVPCGPTSRMCQDRSRYLFWDPYHPSEAANVIVAKYFVDGDTKYISPMNLRQLKDL